MLADIFSLAAEWIWIAAFIPVGLLLRRLLRSFLSGFESLVAKEFEKAGRLTAEFFVRLMQRGLAIGIRSKYYQYLIDSYRDYQIQGLQTRGEFVFDLDKVFVPLRIAPESPGDLTSDMFKLLSSRQNFTIWDLIAIRNEPTYRCIAVIGPPGSGKTTLLRHLTLTFAQYRHQVHNRNARRLLPFLLLLRDHARLVAGNPEVELSHLLNSDLIKPSTATAAWIDRQLNHGNCIVMFDGLDEVGDEETRKTLSRWVNWQMKLFPRVQFILTSRPFGYFNQPLDQIRTILQVRQFNSSEIDQFIDNWYLQNEIMRRLRRLDAGVIREARQRAEHLKRAIKSHAALATIAVNPLLLTMIAIVHDYRGVLPGRRVELYAEICVVMLGRRADAKGIIENLNAHQKQRVLQALALSLMKLNLRAFSPDLGRRLIQERLLRVAGSRVSAENFIVQVENSSGLLVQREAGEYEFAHKSFQEFLAAVEINETNQENILVNNLDDPWWEETVRLYAVQTPNTTSIFGAILSNSSVQNIALAYDCLEEGAEILPNYRNELEERVDLALNSADSAAATLAARVKLAQRLKKLRPLNEQCWIDDEPITCAEYQLFLNSQSGDGEYFQPDHWDTNRFLTGTAAQPVAGVRPEDVRRFCIWLEASHGEPGIRYRAPKLDEIARNSWTEGPIGYWCDSHEGVLLAGGSSSRSLDKDGSGEGITLDDVDVIERNLEILEREINNARNVIRDPNYRVDVKHLRNQTIMYDDISNWNLLGHIAREFAAARDRSKHLERARELERELDLEESVRLLEHLKSALARDIRRNRELDLVFAKKLAAPVLSHDSSLSDDTQTWLREVHGFFAFIESRRRKGAWEGIRIVKEKLASEKTIAKFSARRKFQQQETGSVDLSYQIAEHGRSIWSHLVKWVVVTALVGVLWIFFHEIRELFFEECTLCPEMIEIPEGSFQMGSEEQEEGRWIDEEPLHQVTVRSFALARTEVTFDQWAVCVANGGCLSNPEPDDEGWGGGDRPVINVSWNDAQEYVAWLNSMVTGAPFRLPSEAEWEYAARAGTTTPFAFGDSISTDEANYNGRGRYGSGETGISHGRTIPVSELSVANSWGLQDMHGNVWEWVQDCYQHSYAGAPSDGSAVQIDGCEMRVLRGGSWANSPSFLRSANRHLSDAGSRGGTIGFRVARTIRP